MARTKKPGEKPDNEEQDDLVNAELLNEGEKIIPDNEEQDDVLEREDNKEPAITREKKSLDPVVIQREKEDPPTEIKKPDLPNTSPESNLVFFKKIGGGSLRIGNKIIKPGEKVQLDPDLVKPAWKDCLVPLQEIPVKKETPIVVDVTKSVYKLKQRGENSPWWDIVDGKGKVINDKALRKEKAEEFIRDMML